jgi:hypothetical protein
MAQIEPETTAGARRRTAETALIRTAADVDELLRTGHRPYRRFLLLAPDFAASERNALQSELDRLATECGCWTGSIFVLAALSSYGAYTMFWQSATVLTSTSIWIGVVVALASTLVGKLSGRAYANWQLRRTLIGIRDYLLCDTVRSQVSSKPWPIVDIARRAS